MEQEPAGLGVRHDLAYKPLLLGVASVGLVPIVYDEASKAGVDATWLDLPGLLTAGPLA